MTTEEFKQLLDERIELIRVSLDVKGQEYGAAHDRMNNFKRAAEIVRCTPERALTGFLLKHLVSVLEIVEGISRGVYPDIEKWNEKAGDNINYWILLDIMVRDKILKDAVEAL